MMRPAFQQVAAIPRRAMPTARQNAWEAVWRRQFTSPRRPLTTTPSRAGGTRTGASQSTTRRAQINSWSWIAARLQTVSRASRRTFRFSARQRNTADGKPAQESLSLSQRLKKLSKEYGQLEHWVTSHIKQIIPESVKTWWHEYRAALTKAETQQLGSNDVSEAVEMAGWGVEEAQERNRAEASKFMHLIPLML
ncbi:DUF1279 super [Colletotrichum tropicale]|nr:DUF1279 super [Colletotrichum tropicale]